MTALDKMTKLEMDSYYYDDIELVNFYKWLDRIPFSRPKRNFGKDFSDGVLCCEIIKYYFPRWIELHNYTPASATNQKKENWYLLNRRVLKTSLNMDLSDDIIRSLANGKVKIIEKVLMMVRLQLDKALEKDTKRSRHNNNINTNYNEMDISGSPRHSVNGSLFGKHNSRVLPNSHSEKLPYSNISYITPVIDNVPRSLVEEKELECLAKEETIQILHTKLKRLEHLLHLKDIRIEDLESQARKLDESQTPRLTLPQTSRRSHP